MKSIERLMQYIDYKGLNKRTFEVNNDLSNGYLGKQLSRNADLGEGILTRILDNCPDLSPEWFYVLNFVLIFLFDFFHGCCFI